MFPTIYGIALENVDEEDNTLGSVFLVMAIFGGALMPLIQCALIDQQVILGMPAVNVSFVLPLICFVVVTWVSTQRRPRSFACNYLPLFYKPKM